MYCLQYTVYCLPFTVKQHSCLTFLHYGLESELSDAPFGNVKHFRACRSLRLGKVSELTLLSALENVTSLRSVTFQRLGHARVNSASLSAFENGYCLLFKAAGGYLYTLFLSNTDLTDQTDICRGLCFHTDLCRNRSWNTDYLDNTDICRGNLWCMVKG